MHPAEVIAELKKNQAAFNKIKEEMEADNLGRTVLLHDGEVIDVYDDKGDAYDIACEKFGLGHFSLHLVGERPVGLGIHAAPLYNEE
ncbi:MAG: hypothetical protein F4X34_00435 [Chloroflexi bacterium]|nr:hypothetical protein [Chloroflexota bacterium]